MDQIGDVLQKSQFKSTHDQQACINDMIGECESLIRYIDTPLFFTYLNGKHE